MSAGQHNSAHSYRGTRVGRASRFQSKLTKGGFRVIGVKKLERILKRDRKPV